MVLGLPSLQAVVYITTGKPLPYRVMRQEQTMQVNERKVSTWVFVVMEDAD